MVAETLIRQAEGDSEQKDQTTVQQVLNVKVSVELLMLNSY